MDYVEDATHRAVCLNALRWTMEHWQQPSDRLLKALQKLRMSFYCQTRLPHDMDNPGFVAQLLLDRVNRRG